MSQIVVSYISHSRLDSVRLGSTKKKIISTANFYQRSDLL